jgi:hypothetical protein
MSEGDVRFPLYLGAGVIADRDEKENEDAIVMLKKTPN